VNEAKCARGPSEGRTEEDRGKQTQARNSQPEFDESGLVT